MIAGSYGFFWEGLASSLVGLVAGLLLNSGCRSGPRKRVQGLG